MRTKGGKNDLDAMSKQWRCAAMTRSGSGGSLPPCTSKKESTTTDMDMDGYRWTMDHDERDYYEWTFWRKEHDSQGTTYHRPDKRKIRSMNHWQREIYL